MIERETRPPVSDRVFRTLCDHVLSGRYAPGEKLPTQRELAADLEVNMASVREALKRLEQLRLVESRQGAGMRVTDWRAEGGLDVIAHVLVRSGSLDRKALESVMEARVSMLSEAGRLAAARRSDEAAARLLDLADAIGRTDEAEAAQALDFAFFSEVVEASGNLVFALVLNSIRELYFEHAELFRAIVDAPGPLGSLYTEIAAAVEAHDEAGAAASVRRLAEAQTERLEAALPAADYPPAAGSARAP